MPYIEKFRRIILNVLVEYMGQYLKCDGDLNYVLFAFCKRHVKPSYNNYKNYLGELAEAQAEIRRRLLAPYEDKKIAENGDVEGPLPLRLNMSIQCARCEQLLIPTNIKQCLRCLDRMCVSCFAEFGECGSEGCTR